MGTTLQQSFSFDTSLVGAGVLRKFGADFLCFFSGFHLPDKRNVQTGLLRSFLVRRFLHPFLCRFLVRRFLRPFLRRFLVRRFLRPFLRRFSADFSLTFWRLKNRCSRVTQKCAEKYAASEWPCSGGAPHSLSTFSSRQHVTQSPLGRHTQGEHVSVHRDIFGLKGMLAFAPRFFKNENLQKNELCETPAPTLAGSFAKGFVGCNLQRLCGVTVQKAWRPQRPSARYPPPYRAIPFRDSIVEGVSHPLPCFQKGIAQVSLRYPFWGGGGLSHLHFACSLRGKCSEKGDGVSHPIAHVETPKTP